MHEVHVTGKTIMKSKLLLLPLLLAPALGACSHGDRETGAFQHLSIADNGDVIAHARDGANARIDAAGDLEIQGKSVAVNPAQRKLLQSYHADALALRNVAVATGKAGVQTGLTALSAVASGLASGNPDSIDSKVDAKAGKVDALAATVCRDLAHLYADQREVTAAIPAFAPYATIDSHDASDCNSD